MLNLPWGVELLLFAVALYLLICLIAFIIQGRLLFIPTVEAPGYDYKLATPSQEWTMATPNGGQIHGLLLRSAHSRGLIFYLHGNTGSIRRWRFMAEEVSTYGFDVCIMDYRSYGKSKGKRRESWMHEDVKQVYEHFKSAYSGQAVIVYGRSLGTGFAVRLAAVSEADALVLETPFYNMLDVANHYFPFLPMTFLLRFRFRSDFWINKVKCPVILFHGTKDRIVPYRSALKLFHKVQSKESVSMITIPGGRHNNLNTYPLFYEKLSSFLTQAAPLKNEEGRTT